MALQVMTPKLGTGQRPGILAEWYEVDGTLVRKGQPIFLYESDYCAVEMEAEADGVLRLRTDAGAETKPGHVLAYILGLGEELPLDPEPEPEEAAFEVDAPAVLPLRRGAGLARPFEPVTRSWGPVPGDSQAFDRPEWPLAAGPGEDVEEPAPEISPAVEEHMASEPSASVADDSWEMPPAAEAAGEDDREAVSFEDALGAFEESYEVQAAAGPEPEPEFEREFEPEFEIEEPVPAPVIVPEWHDTCDEAAAAKPVAVVARATVPGIMTATVKMAEARKMREQLSREWKDARPPENEDILLRAVARAAAEQQALDGIGDTAGLLLPAAASQPVICVSSAARGPFRERVQTLAEGRHQASQADAAFTVTSFAGFNIDSGTPVLPDGHPFAVAAGAMRAVFESEGLPFTPVLTLTLSYDPGRLSVGEAAVLLSRIRELIEAPYALLAD